jgi:hypothetical protein
MKTKLTVKNPVNLRERKSSKKSALYIGALVAFSLCATAQNNVSYNTDAIPVPGGSDNVVVGLNSLLSNTGGGANATYGNFSMNQNINGSANTAGGYAALYQSDGDFNSTFGVKSMASNTSGSYNSALGAYALDNNVDGKLNTAVGTFADVANTSLSNATAVGNGAVVQNSDLVQLGDANVTQIECWSGVYTTTSDGRFKFAISENDVKGLDFINRLRPVVYNMDTKKLTEFMTKNLPEDARKVHMNKNFEKSTAVRQSGFIAQEVEAAAKATGYNFNGVQVPKDANGHYSVSYSQFVVPLVKAVQEQQAMIENQKQQLEEQKRMISELQQRAELSTGINQNSLNTGYQLGQNEPNPFSHETIIKYTLPESVSNAYVAVYDLSGKQLTTFAINQKGSAALTITSEKLAAGIYIYSIVADGKILDSKRMIVADK